MNVFSDQLSGLTALLSKPKNIVIVPHKDPDGDAIGSCLAWYNVLSSGGHKPKVISPNDVPVSLQWMKGAKEIIDFNLFKEIAIEVIHKADMFLFLDFNNISRIGDLADEILPCTAPRVIIDHHPLPDVNLGQILISDTGVSSTCELSYKVMKSINIIPDVHAGECLYTGMMTDTGILNHNSSHPFIYHAVADLLEIGIDKDKIHKKVFHSNSLNRMRLLGHALCNKMEIFADGKVALIVISEQELKNFDYQPGDTEGLVNYPLSIEGVEVSVLMTEREKTLIKISFRSRGKVAVNKYSEMYFSGGGHRNAAGGINKEGLQQAIDLLHLTIQDYILNNDK